MRMSAVVTGGMGLDSRYAGNRTPCLQVSIEEALCGFDEKWVGNDGYDKNSAEDPQRHCVARDSMNHPV
jgi:hypothetical protein